jgi:type I restriction enzyme, S subunit
MSSKRWKETILGEIAQINMGQSPESKYYNSNKEGYPFLQGNRTFGYRYPHFDTYCTEGKKFADKGEVLVSVRAPVGDINIATERICIGRGVASLKINNGMHDFLFYLLKANVSELINKESGTVFGSVNKDDLFSLRVKVPESVEVQLRISSILSSFDEKIELNRQTNRTLESIAQAIYKEWFVNFNFPGATGEMQDSELGPIPQGWRVGEYTNELNVVYGKNLPTVNLLPTGYPVFGGNGLIGFYDKFLYEDPQVIVACRGAASGKVNQSLPNSFVTNNSLVFEIPKNSRLKFTYLKQICLNTDFTSFVSGSAQPQLTIESFKNAFLLIPDEQIIHLFDELISPIEKFVRENNMQSNYLSQIRNVLLPRLMSGEIEV